MTVLLLVRHGRTVANARGELAGRRPGVELDGRGRAQAAALATRLAGLELSAVVSSPLERCQATAAAVLTGRSGPASHLEVDPRLTECGYGEWTGRPIAELAGTELWQVVQRHPSAAVFPGPDGEAMAAMQARAVAAVRDWNSRVGAGPYLVCTHGDVVKALVADALGLHLDLFQRITVDPGSLTVIRYTPTRPFLLRLNDTGGPLDGLWPVDRPAHPPSGDAVVGGGSG